MAKAVFRVEGDIGHALSSVQKLLGRIENLEQKVNQFSQKASKSGDRASAGFKKAGKAAKDLGEKVQKTTTKANQLNKTLSAMSVVAGGVAAAMKFSGRAIMKVRDYYMAVVDAARLATQGITNFGRSLFFFVSLPLAAMMRSILGAAIDFEDQMVRVGKTTGLWGDALTEVQEGIRQIARYTSTSHVDLAIMAEQIGQMGISAKDRIVELVNLFNMFSVTTTVTAEEVAIQMGRIANAFGWNLNESTESTTRLANVINYLENTTASSASEIVGSLYKIAPVAGLLNISAQDAAAFAASLVSTGFSAEEAGTAVRNLFYYMTKNRDAIANAMRGYEKYNTIQKITNELNRDFAQVILDITDAMEDGNESVDALVNSIEIGSLRGGKALAAFGNSFDMLSQNIANARAEWTRANSLMLEYEKAMSSTKAQMGLLRNNIIDVGITLGQVLLPYINKLIMVLVPAIQDFNKYFAGLADKTKLMAVAAIGLVIVLGPVVMFLGQMLHGVTLLMMGFGQLMKVFTLVTGGIGKIALGINWLLKIFAGFSISASSIGGAIASVFAWLTSSIWGWVAIIAVAVVAVLKILSNFGVDVAGFFTNIADKAAEWGANLMETYGNGLAKGFAYVLNVVAWIANAIASFFEAHSPPKAGPLKTIDKWGSKLMETYLKGFYLADFDILSGVGRIIERYLTMGAQGDDTKMVAALRKVLKARTALAGLIDLYNKTGQIEQGLLSKATAGLGKMAQHVQKLIVLWLDYNRIQQRIKELEERRKDVVKGYQDEIASIGKSNMSLEDKVNAIRAARYNRDNELRAIDKEKAALEDQSDEMQDQLKWQQKFVDAMMQQEDIFTRLNKTLEKMSKKLDGLGAGFGGNIGEEIKKAFEEVEESFTTLKERLSEGRQLWEAFLAGFRGEDPITGAAAKFLPDDYYEFYNLGVKAGEIKDKVLEAWSTVQGWAETMTTVWNNLTTGVGNAKTAVLDFVTTVLPNLFSGGFGSFNVDTLKGAFLDLLHRIYAAMFMWIFEDEEDANEFATRWVDIFLDITKITGEILRRSKEVVGALIDAYATYFEDERWKDTLGYKILSAVGMALGWFVENIDLTFLQPLIDAGKAMMDGLLGGFKDRAQEAIKDFTKSIEDIIAAVKETLGIESPSTVFFEIGKAIIQGMWDGMLALWEEVRAWFNTAIEELPGWLKRLLNISSPSRVMMELGEYTIQGFLLGMQNAGGGNLGAAASAAIGIGNFNLPAAPLPIGAGIGNLTVQVNNPTVREDEDIDRIAEAVAEKLSEALYDRQKLGGHSSW